MIPLGRPSITPDDLAAVATVLRGRRLTQGEEVAAFESEVAARGGTDHAVLVSSGTAAMAVSLAALGIGTGDRVLVPGYSWVSTANVVELAGATPVFVDIDPETFGMSPIHLSEIIQDLRSRKVLSTVKALIPVHVFGYIAEMDEISRIADAAGVPIVEDAACALGASLSGRPAGSLGKVGCFSFHPLKVVTSGEGGAITTNDADTADFARAYRNHGQRYLKGERSFAMAGPNLRMTDFQAALGRSQLARLDTMIDERHRLTERYHEQLSGLPLRFQRYDPHRTSSQAFAVVLDRPRSRSGVLAALKEHGVEASVGTIALPFTEHARHRYGLAETDLPFTARIGSSALSLPLYNGMTTHDQDVVVTALEKILDGGS